MRPSLYIKDDDYRYSFLFGNFITLTNLKDKDWQRLEEQRLSPLYVSVHTTSPELRRQMVDGPRAGEILDHIRRLADLRITCHTQLVLCPTINDAGELDRSIADLAGLRPTVESISVVPVGLTKYNNMLKTGDLPALRPYTAAEAAQVMARVERWQRHFEAEQGMPFVLLSDEWYYLTRRTFPPARHYGDYAQIENGVGMTRHLLDAWRHTRRQLPDSLAQPGRLAIVTGTMAIPVMERIAADLRRVGGLEARLVPVQNRFFGPTTTVAGLLCGQDVLDDVRERCADFTSDDVVLLPRVLLDNAGKQFLDDMTVDDFRAQVVPEVRFARTAEELLAAVMSLAQARRMAVEQAVPA
jgi:putative radical SAM enzyme (TIGR03279 family)